MTKQANDYLTWLGEKYPVIMENFLEPYLLENYPIRPNITGGITALYRGYIADLEVKNAQLYLSNLDVYFMDKPYPNLGDNVPKELTEIARYEAMTERIYGTGHIIIAKNRIGNHYDERRALHRYRKLIRFDFKGGKTHIFDLSSKAAEIRTHHMNPKYPHVTQKEEKATNNFTHQVLWADNLSL